MKPDALLKKIRLSAARTDTVPREFRTEAEWARRWNYSTSYARKILMEGVNAGVMVRKRFRIPVGSFCRMTWHYAEAKKTKRH